MPCPDAGTPPPPPTTAAAERTHHARRRATGALPRARDRRRARLEHHQQRRLRSPRRQRQHHRHRPLAPGGRRGRPRGPRRRRRAAAARTGALGLRVGKFHDRQCVRAAHRFVAQRDGLSLVLPELERRQHAPADRRAEGDHQRRRQLLGHASRGHARRVRGSGVRPAAVWRCSSRCAGRSRCTSRPTAPTIRACSDYVAELHGRRSAGVLAQGGAGRLRGQLPHARVRSRRTTATATCASCTTWARASSASWAARPTARAATTYWDFDLSFRPEELATPSWATTAAGARSPRRCCTRSATCWRPTAPSD